MKLDYILEISDKVNPPDVKVFKFIPSIESLPTKIGYCKYETEQEKKLQEFILSTRVAKEWLVELGYDLNEYSWSPTTKQIESKAGTSDNDLKKLTLEYQLNNFDENKEQTKSENI